jgi:orotidine-5'-phosphate decarboxylase
MSATSTSDHASAGRLIVALDVADAASARALIAELGDAAGFYKIGLELLFSGGLDLARDLKRDGKQVFLDLKFLDIANTVERAVAQAGALGVDLLTVHGLDSKTLAAAVRGRGASATKLLAVTVLTSLDKSDLAEQGIALDTRDVVLKRARLAKSAGFDGCVASGLEARAVRDATGDAFLIVTPGIRLAGDAAQDQARVTTPDAAIASGATHLVVGRPITAARDPRAAAWAFRRAIEAGLTRQS